LLNQLDVAELAACTVSRAPAPLSVAAPAPLSVAAVSRAPAPLSVAAVTATGRSAVDRSSGARRTTLL